MEAKAICPSNFVETIKEVTNKIYSIRGLDSGGDKACLCQKTLSTLVWEKYGLEMILMIK